MAHWIRTREALESFATDLARCRAVAMDSESDSLHHYSEKVCLVQIATDGGESRLVDTLALDDLDPLKPIIADPGIVKVFHGADYDVTTMKRDFAFDFEGLFDTMIAARFTGATQFGLQALLRAEFGVELSKARQKDDWSMRPLNASQEAYALADVAHLLPLRERLFDRLKTLGRLEWVLEECTSVAALEPARRKTDPLAYQRHKGAKALPPRSLAVLRAVSAWREESAALADVPPFKVLSSETLVALATERPKTREDLARIRGLPRSVRGNPRPLLDAIAGAEAIPDALLPTVPRKRLPAVPESVRSSISRLRAWRSMEAVRLGLDISLVLPQRLLEQVAERSPKDPLDLQEIPGMRRWRVREFGNAMVSALLS